MRKAQLACVDLGPAAVVRGALAALLPLIGLATRWLGRKVAPIACQDAADDLVVGSALTASEPSFAFIQRAGFSTASIIVAVLPVTARDALVFFSSSNQTNQGN